jgi:hypothetical protein
LPPLFRQIRRAKQPKSFWNKRGNALTGAVTANAVIVGAGNNGSVDVFALSATDLVIDITGYFALPGAGGRSARATRVLTMWPQGQPQPLAATLNAGDGAVTSNMAIIPTNNGSVSAFALNPTHLVLDVFAYFAP